MSSILNIVFNDEYFDAISDDTLFDLLLSLEPQDLNNFCRSRRRVNVICQDPVFQKAYERQFHLYEREKYKLDDDLEEGFRVAGELNSKYLLQFFITQLPPEGEISRNENC